MTQGDNLAIISDWIEEVMIFVETDEIDPVSKYPRTQPMCRYVRTENELHHAWKGRAGDDSSCMCGRREWAEYKKSPELAEWVAGRK